MFYSKKHKILFIASPKTGTVSVHDALEKLDPDGHRRVIEYGGKKVSCGTKKKVIQLKMLLVEGLKTRLLSLQIL